MSETTEKMDPCVACCWYYEQRAWGREMEQRLMGRIRGAWHLDDGVFHADRIYRLKQRVLRRSHLVTHQDGDSFETIEDPGPEAVILSRMPTEEESISMTAYEFCKKMQLEVKR